MLGMDATIKEQVIESTNGLSLPRYKEIPDVGLYLDQVTQYVNNVITPLGVPELTSSMVSNYVKQGLVDNPQKKRYSADQVAYLIFISVAKTVLSIENIRTFISIQKSSYDTFVAYDYFCTQLEFALEHVFGLSDVVPDTGKTRTEEKNMLRHCCIAMANVCYLNKCFDLVRERNEQNQ